MNRDLEETITNENLPVSRRQAREMALKALYALELSGNSVTEVLSDIVPFYQRPEEIAQFTRQLVEKTFEKRDELDSYIRLRSKNWEFDRIAIIDKIVLRIAICEFLHFWDVPPKVSIDEALELAKIYSTSKSTVFVNGVLDGVLADLQEKGEIIKTGRGLRDKKNRR